MHPPPIAKTSCNAHRFSPGLLFQCLGEQLTSTFHLYVYEMIPSAYKDTINDMILWKPRAASRSNWVTKTGLPFDPFESTAVLLHQDLLCPKCKAAVSIRECSAPTLARTPGFTRGCPAYIIAAGTGYAQQNFSYTCSFCTFEITRERLAVAKLTTDLTTHLLHEPQAGVMDMQLHLP